MDRFEWLEYATADIALNTQAREVRQELNAHLSAIVDDLLREGQSPAEAEAEAVHRMGEARHLRDDLASACQSRLSRQESRRVGLGGILATGGVTSILLVTQPHLMVPAVDAAFIVPLLVGAYLIGSVLYQKTRQHPNASVGRRLKTHALVAVVWALFGLVVGLQPLALHAAATGSPFPLPWYVWRDVAVLWLIAVGLLTIPSLVTRSVVHAVGSLGAALGAFAIMVTASALATWRLWPVAPPVGVGSTPRWEWWTNAFPWDTVNGVGSGKTFHWLPNPAWPHLAHSVAELTLFMALATVIGRAVGRVLVPALGKAGRYVWLAVRPVNLEAHDEIGR